MTIAETRHGELQRRLRAARERTLAFAADLDGAQLLGPRLAIVNPPLWELGHLAWFQERWCLRPSRGPPTLLPSVLPAADALYDSASVAHATRWDLPLPDLDATRAYLHEVLARVLERLDGAHEAALEYFAELAAAHEEMHNEAFTYTRQTLGYRGPRAAATSMQAPGGPTGQPDVELAGGEFMLGASPDDGFVFDNEKWAHPVTVAPFRIARTCVTNGELATFVEDGGYERRELWCTQGWAWRERAAATAPLYWRRDGDAWHIRRYEDWTLLPAREPALHINWYEARAYCRWAGRRLPTEAEWEFAAASAPGDALAKRRYPWGEAAPTAERANLFGAAQHPIDVAALSAGDSAWGCRQMIGNVWEWTADAFAAYAGFVVDPYKEYSEPWFGSHKVLRGGCHATSPALIRNTWRNFYTPDRRDVFGGFRTCA